jgi:hypothetical protein
MSSYFIKSANNVRNVSRLLLDLDSLKRMKKYMYFASMIVSKNTTIILIK